MEGITIRRATDADHAALADILLPVFRAGDTYAIDPGMGAADAVAYWCGADRMSFVAERADGILGTYYIRPNQGGGGAHVCNCGYVTARGAEGQGVARAMLDHSLSEAVAQGYRAMQFNFVVASNDRAVATWHKAGFRTVGRLPGAFQTPNGTYEDALVMWKTL